MGAVGGPQGLPRQLQRAALRRPCRALELDPSAAEYRTVEGGAELHPRPKVSLVRIRGLYRHSCSEIEDEYFPRAGAVVVTSPALGGETVAGEDRHAESAADRAEQGFGRLSGPPDEQRRIRRTARRQDRCPRALGRDSAD